MRGIQPTQFNAIKLILFISRKMNRISLSLMFLHIIISTEYGIESLLNSTILIEFHWSPCYVMDIQLIQCNVYWFPRIQYYIDWNSTELHGISWHPNVLSCINSIKCYWMEYNLIQILENSMVLYWIESILSGIKVNSVFKFH